MPSVSVVCPEVFIAGTGKDGLKRQMLSHRPLQEGLEPPEAGG
jgi:hypothetical protein